MGTLHTIPRRTFYTVAALSTLLLLATLILWPVSHYRYVAATYKGEDEEFISFASASGRVRVQYFFSGDAGEPPSPPGWYFRAGIPSGAPWSYLT